MLLTFFSRGGSCMKRLFFLAAFSLLLFGCTSGPSTPQATPYVVTTSATATPLPTPTPEPIKAASNEVIKAAEASVPISTGFLAEAAGVKTKAPSEYFMTSEGSAALSVSLKPLTEMQFADNKIIEAIKRVATASHYVKTVSVTDDSFELNWIAVDSQGKPGDIVAAKLYKNRESRICVNEASNGAALSEQTSELQFANGYGIGDTVTLSNGYTLKIRDIGVIPPFPITIDVFDADGVIVDSTSLTSGTKYSKFGLDIEIASVDGSKVEFKPSATPMEIPTPTDTPVPSSFEKIFEGRLNTGERGTLSNNWQLKLMFVGFYAGGTKSYGSYQIYDGEGNLMDVGAVAKGENRSSIGIDSKVTDTYANSAERKYWAEFIEHSYPYVFPTPPPTAIPTATPEPATTAVPTATATTEPGSTTQPTTTIAPTSRPTIQPAATPKPGLKLSDNCIIPTRDQVSELWKKLQGNQLEEAIALFVPDATLKTLLKIEKKSAATYAGRPCNEYDVSLTDEALSNLNQFGGTPLSDLKGTFCLDTQYGFPLKTELKSSLATLSERVMEFSDAKTASAEAMISSDVFLQAKKTVLNSVDFLPELAGVSSQVPAEYLITTKGSFSNSLSVSSLANLQFTEKDSAKVLKRVFSAQRNTKVIRAENDLVSIKWTSTDVDGNALDSVEARIYKNRPSGICVKSASKTTADLSMTPEYVFEKQSSLLQFADTCFTPPGYPPYHLCGNNFIYTCCPPDQACVINQGLPNCVSPPGPTINPTATATTTAQATSSPKPALRCDLAGRPQFTGKICPDYGYTDTRCIQCVNGEIVRYFDRRTDPQTDPGRNSEGFDCVVPTSAQVLELLDTLKANPLEDEFRKIIPDARLKELLKVEKKGGSTHAGRACTEYDISLKDETVSKLSQKEKNKLADLKGTTCLDAQYGFPLKTEIKSTQAGLSEIVIYFSDSSVPKASTPTLPAS